MARQAFSESDNTRAVWEDVRSNRAFLAFVGGLVGAFGGAALVFLLSRLREPKLTLPAAYDEAGNPMKVVYLPPPKSATILGFKLSDWIALAKVGLSLVHQLQEWKREKMKNSP